GRAISRGGRAAPGGVSAAAAGRSPPGWAGGASAAAWSARARPAGPAARQASQAAAARSTASRTASAAVAAPPAGVTVPASPAPISPSPRQVVGVVPGAAERAAQVAVGDVLRVRLAVLGDELGGEDLGVVLRLVADGAALLERPPAPGVGRDEIGRAHV